MKPDQLIKRRGKLGLLKVNCNWDTAKQWVEERRGKELQVNTTPLSILLFWLHLKITEILVKR